MSWFPTFFVGLVVVVFGLMAVALATLTVIVFGEALVLAYRALRSQ